MVNNEGLCYSDLVLLTKLINKLNSVQLSSIGYILKKRGVTLRQICEGVRFPLEINLREITPKRDKTKDKLEGYT